MGQYEIGHPQPEARDLATCPLLAATGLVLALDNLGRPCCDIGFGPHMRGGLQDPPALRRSETCFGKPDGPAPSAKITERARATARVCHGCHGSLARKIVADGPAPSAEITECARATARVCHGCRRPRSPRFASLGNLFREARRANPQRQNDGSEREGGCRRSFGRRPENCVGKPDGPAPSAKITERARATARVCHGCRGSFGRRPESCFEKPDGPAPSVKITGASASDAPPPRLSRKLRPSPRKFSWEARRA